MRVISPTANSVKFTYDADGNMLTSTDQRNNTTNYTYDSLDRRSTRTDPLNATETSTYAANGLLDSFTARNGQITKRTYDTINRLSFIGYGATAQAPTTYESTINYTYDNGDRLMTIVDSASGEIDYTYDDLDRMKSETTPLGSVQYDFDDAGRRTEMRPTQQTPVDYSYNDANQLIELDYAGDAVHITYDSLGRYATITLRNGVTETYTYDAAGQLTNIDYATATTTIGGLTYSYDATGKAISEGGTMVNVNLPAAMSGNTYNANNQLSMSGYSYDSNGRLTSKGASAFTWDARDQLASISGPVPAQFSYDALGRRIRKSINSVPTQFLYDGANYIQELGDGSSPSVQATTVTGFGLDEVFGRTEGATKLDYLNDRLGSTVALSNEAGVPSTTYSSEPYGESVASGAATTNSRQFTGRENDGNGFIYYRARYYDPIFQRFMSEDPFGSASGDLNAYRYVQNSPLNAIDPTGTTPIPIPIPAPLCFVEPWLCVAVLVVDACLAGAIVGTMARERNDHRSCSCQHRDDFESGGISCEALRKAGICAPPGPDGKPTKYIGTDFSSQAACQASARALAPAACRGCLGHCGLRSF